MDRRIIVGIVAVVVLGLVLVLFARPRNNEEASAAADQDAVASSSSTTDLELETEAPAAVEEEVASTKPPSEPTDPPPTAVPPTSPPVAAGVPVTDFVTPPELASEPPPGQTQRDFTTDFNKHNISYQDILSGGPPKDGIPAIDNPQFIGVGEADEWLQPKEPVVLISVDGEARAYPLQVLTWHEIVNDTLNGLPIVVTFCPLCNTAIAFSREFDNQVLDFGTTGRLRFSNLIMYDRQTETWWQQASGDAIAGLYTGSQLEFLPAAIVAWDDFKEAHPESQVLSRDTGFRRDYGRNPYTGYDNINNTPFAFRGPDNSDRLLPMARVLTVELNDEGVAYPFADINDVGVVNDEVGGEPIAIFWQEGTASALDSNVLAQGRDVGTANSFSRELDGQVLTFSLIEGEIVDDQTGTTWDVLGTATSGELEGSQLEPVVGVNHFWFSWAAFKPETRIWQPS